jgi:hypothetical protein
MDSKSPSLMGFLKGTLRGLFKVFATNMVGYLGEIYGGLGDGRWKKKSAPKN